MAVCLVVYVADPQVRRREDRSDVVIAKRVKFHLLQQLSVVCALEVVVSGAQSSLAAVSTDEFATDVEPVAVRICARPCLILQAHLDPGYSNTDHCNATIVGLKQNELARMVAEPANYFNVTVVSCEVVGVHI